MSFNLSASMYFMNDEALLGSRDDPNMLDGQNKHPSAMTSYSDWKKRGRKATGNATDEATLEIAAASRMRANAGG